MPHKNRPPCTQNATASNASKKKPRSSSVETDERFSTGITSHGSLGQTHGGLTLDAGSDLYPRKHRIHNTCTQKAIANNASASQHESSSEHFGGTLRTTAESSTVQPFADSASATSLRGASASPSWSERGSLNGPNTCTQNATDASGSASKPSDFNAAPPDSAFTTPEVETRGSPKSGATSLSTNDCSSPKKRGRQRKLPSAQSAKDCTAPSCHAGTTQSRAIRSPSESNRAPNCHERAFN